MFVCFIKDAKEECRWSTWNLQKFYSKIQVWKRKKETCSNCWTCDTLDHYIWNGLNTVQYKLILGDCEKLTSIVPKNEYSLFIADILHGYNIANIEYDTEPYTYQDFSKVVLGFIEVTTSPFWRFLVFHSNTQQGLVQSSFKGKKRQGGSLFSKILKVYV